MISGITAGSAGGTTASGSTSNQTTSDDSAFANYLGGALAANASSTGTQSSTSSSTATDPAKEFLDYMNKTPAQRFMENWLQAHHITQAEFDAMSPAEKKKILDQIAQDMKNKIKESTGADPNSDPTANLSSGGAGLASLLAAG